MASMAQHSRATCPADAELAQFVERRMRDVEAERIRSHLDDCDSCRWGVQVWVQGSRGDAPPVLDALAAGAMLGHYRLERRLGAGGMGVVYEAFDDTLQRKVAIKVLLGDGQGTRLLAEARAQAKITHPGVLTVYEVGEHDGLVYIAMELIRGRTLRAHLAKEKPDTAGTLALFARAALGLEAAHAEGVVHRDFKPDNVLVDEDPATGAARRVLVADFGLATLAGNRDSGDLAHGSPRGGTPVYMAPEQHGSARIDARADVFAFGVAVWEGLYGAPPFIGHSIGELRAAMARPPEPPARPRLPTRVKNALVASLSIDPAGRPASMAAMARALAPRSRRPFAIAAVAAGVLVATAAVAWGVSGRATHALPPPSSLPATLAIADCMASSQTPWPEGHGAWMSRATSAGVPAWVRARVDAVMQDRDVELASMAPKACAAVEDGGLRRRAWLACRTEQEVWETATLEALATPWTNVEHLGQVLELPWITACDSQSARLTLVLEPGDPADAAALAAARTTMARAVLDGYAGKPEREWKPALDALLVPPTRPAVSARLGIEVRLQKLLLLPSPTSTDGLALIDEATAIADSSGDLVGEARAWAYKGAMLAGAGADEQDVAAAMSRADKAISRVGDPADLRSLWHATMVGAAWIAGDIVGARAHADAAATLAPKSSRAWRRAVSAQAQAAGAAGDFAGQAKLYAVLLVDVDAGLVPAREAVDDYGTYAEALFNAHEPKAAAAALERAFTLYDEVKLDDPLELAQLMHTRANIDLEDERYDDCLHTLAEAEALIRSTPAPDSSFIGDGKILASAALGAQGKYREAVVVASEATAIFDKSDGEASEGSIKSREQAGEMLFAAGDLAGSEAVLRRALPAARAFAGPDARLTAEVEVDLGRTLARRAVRRAEALTLCEHALGVLAKDSGSERVEIARTCVADLRPS